MAVENKGNKTTIKVVIHFRLEGSWVSSLGDGSYNHIRHCLGAWRV